MKLFSQSNQEIMRIYRKKIYGLIDHLFSPKNPFLYQNQKHGRSDSIFFNQCIQTIISIFIFSRILFYPHSKQKKKADSE